MIKQILYILSILTILLSSCSRKHILYLQDKDEFFDEAKNEFINQEKKYKIKKGDILHIDIISSNEKINQLFNINKSNSTDLSGNGGGFYLSGYLVNDSGYIQLPIINDIFVKDFTINQIQDIIQQKANVYLKQAIVNVRFVSFRISFLGEFASKGQHVVYQNKVNILNGIAMAGGLSDYADKRKLLIIRNTSTGLKTIRVDVTKRNLLEKEEYYLRPNDIVIAEPIRSKVLRLNMNDYFLIITTISSTITTILLIANFMK